MANLKAEQHLDWKLAVAIKQPGIHEGHLCPPLPKAGQVEGEEIVWGGQARVKSSKTLFSPL